MKKPFFGQKIFCMAAAACLLWSAPSYGALYNTQNNTEVFTGGTKINGVGVAGMTPDEAKAQIEELCGGGYTLTLIGADGRKEIIGGKEIGLKAALGEGLPQILAEQNEGGRISGPAVINSYDLPMETYYNGEALKGKLASLELVSGADVKKMEDARIAANPNGEGFVIIPETEGNEIDLDRLTEAVSVAILNHQTALNLKEAGCYRQVQIRSTDETLKNRLTAMNQLGNISITYHFGETSEVLDGTAVSPWILGTDGTTVIVDPNQAAAYVRGLAEKYDTAGKPRLFLTASGQEVTVTGPYGWKIDQAAETQALIAAIMTCQSSEREPVYSQTAASRTGNDYGITYVEVDLGNQHMYLVENGQCTLDAPFVSGNVSKGWTTPPGIFGLSYKQRDAVLRGADYASPVKYWMPFNGGIGLHDADWRGSFGGSIYKTSGSHGCINLPPQKAAVLFEHVYKNMPIICHN